MAALSNIPVPGFGAGSPMPVSVGGIVTLASARHVAEQERAQATQANNTPAIQGLAGYIRECWVAARTAKQQTVEQRMLQNVRARRGEYDPDKLAQIRAHGGSEIYMMLTSVKCRAASSWLRDALLGVKDERPWTLSPTPVPDMDPAVVQETMLEASQEIAGILQQGMNVDPALAKAILQGTKDRVTARLKEQAQIRCERMALKIEDQLLEGGWTNALSQFIDDLTTFPSAIIKGPIVRRKKCMRWAQGAGRPTMEIYDEFRLEWERVDPFRFYPAAHATDIDDGYMIEHHKLSRSDLQAMKGVDGYSDPAINMVLFEYGQRGLTEWLADESVRNDAEGKSTAASISNPEHMIDALQFWGNVQGKMLIEWGMDESEVDDPLAEYSVEAWLIGNWVIKATLNYDPLGRKPYYKTSYESLPGSFWGNGVADLVRDCQMMCNHAARSLANNLGIASGPQVYVLVDRLPPGEDLTQMYPWKMWQGYSDFSGGTAPPVGFFQPDSHAEELMRVYERFSILADEYSGVPRYMTGTEGTPGAGRTASGLSMMIGNAGKAIKQVVSNVDVWVLSPLIERAYHWNMRYGDDPDLMGDAKVVARGATSLMVKENAQLRRNEFLQATANSVDLGIMGIEGRAHLLRDWAKDLGGNTDKIVPPPEVLRMRQAIQAMTQQQMMLAGPQQGGKPGGETLMDGSPTTDNFSPQAMAA